MPSSAVGPRRGRQAAGEDRVDVGRHDRRSRRRARARIRAEQAGRQRPVAEDRAGLDGATVSRPIARSGARSSTRGSFAVRAARASRPSSRPGRDRAADVGAVGGDAVEGRRRPEVDDDRRRAVEARRREGVDEPVGPDVARAGRPGSAAARCPAERDEDRAARGARRSPRGRRSATARPRRSAMARRRPARRRRAGAGPSAAARARRRSRRGVGRGAPGRDERAVPERAEREVRVADVDGQEHGAR